MHPGDKNNKKNTIHIYKHTEKKIYKGANPFESCDLCFVFFHVCANLANIKLYICVLKIFHEILNNHNKIVSLPCVNGIKYFP